MCDETLPIHYAANPFHAWCGADVPNQRTTQEWAHTTCQKCLLAPPNDAPLTENWLRAAGFRWDQLDRQPTKHWLLWLGAAVKEPDARVISPDDLGVVLASMSDGRWNCWVRADYAGRYSRFVHIRYVRTIADVTTMISALVGFAFDPANVWYGSLRTAEDARRLREDEEQQLHRKMAKAWGVRVMHETGADPDKRELLKP